MPQQIDNSFEEKIDKGEGDHGEDQGPEEGGPDEKQGREACVAADETRYPRLIPRRLSDVHVGVEEVATHRNSENVHDAAENDRDVVSKIFLWPLWRLWPSVEGGLEPGADGLHLFFKCCGVNRTCFLLNVAEDALY